jgi:1,4-alpha-glucan branching enzyme
MTWGICALGVNAIQLLPTHEFPGDNSWGYNPSHIFSVESAYGGPDALKRLVDQAHKHGIAVILDVVYNHLGPNDLSIWQFDGWFERWNGEDMGGIYFYND